MMEVTELDRKILDALANGEWKTADAIASRGLRSRTVDATVISGRLRSLKSRAYVESRPHGPMNEWRRRF